MQQGERASTVVVGSGFGGSVTAYRLAQAGQDVVLLERGRPYPPGSFARTPADMSRNFWDPSAGLHGLFDIWSFRGLEAVLSSGLGGGSLIYANVLIRKDEKWFVTEDPLGDGYESWPLTRADLEPHYDAVEAMIGVQRFPHKQPGYERSAKTSRIADAAGRLDLDWALAPLAVTFGQGSDAPAPGRLLEDPPYGNLHGRPRRSCTLSGECDLGCNEGAKNTLDHTYLSAAKHEGADLRTGCEVRSFAPDGDGWVVRYVVHREEDAGRPTATSQMPLHEIRADRLVLAAGAFGSTFLLLRNRSVLPGLSRMIGHRFSGNGDLLGFIRGVPPDGPHHSLGSSNAPVITSRIRVPDRVDGGSGRGYYIEDAGYPGFTDWLFEATDVAGLGRRLVAAALATVRARLGADARSNVSALVGRTLGEGLASGGSTPLLGMGRDIPDGVMRLREGYLDLDWTTRTSRAYFDEVRRTMAALARELGGEFIENPLSHLRRVVTVHPLGGAPMGADAHTGVVGTHGEVFGHPGLFVADGAAMPGPVGANPSLTIAAFADRMCERLLEGAPA